MDVNDALGSYGLRVYEPGRLEGLDGWWLAIANRHATLGTLLANTKWAAGGWAQSAARVPGARKWPVALRFDGLSQRVTLMPLALVRDPTADTDRED